MQKRFVYWLIWDGRNIEHIWRHGLMPRDVEDVMSYPFREERIIRNRGHGERLMIRGRSRGGRKLVVFLRPSMKHGVSGGV